VFEISVLLLLATTMIQNLKFKNQNDNPKVKNLTIILYSIFIILFVLSSLAGSYMVGFSRDSLGIIKSWVLVPVIFGYLIGVHRHTCLSARQGFPQPEGSPLGQISTDQSEESNSSQKLQPTTYNLQPVFFGLYTSVMLVSLWAIAQKLGIISTLLYQAGDTSFTQYLGANFRAFGSFESPNYLAMFIVPSAILALGLNQKVKTQNQKILKWIFYLSYILPLSALAFSRSRAGFIALIGAALVYSTVMIYRSIRNKSYSAVFIVLSIILYSLFLLLFYHYGLRPGSDAIRFEIYGYAINLVKENWLWGIGAGNFQAMIKTFDLSSNFITYGLPNALHPHNLYLALILNFGLLGLISFLGLSILAMYRLLKIRSVGAALILASLTAILIHGVFDTTYFKNDLSAIYWLIIFMAVYDDKYTEA